MVNRGQRRPESTPHSSGGALDWPDPLPAHGTVRLRPFTENDLGLVAVLATDPYLPLIGTIPLPFTPEEGLAYIERQRERLTDGTGWSFVVVDATTGQAVGSAGLWLNQGRPASAGYSVAPEFRGRGYATAALTALTRFAWTVPEIDRIELYIEPANRASARVAQHCGYREEALLPDNMEIGGRLRSMLRFAANRPK